MGQRENFEKYYEHSIKNNLEADPFKEILWRFYVQGSHDPNDEDISLEQANKMVEDQCFIDFIQSCIENPNDCTPMKGGDYVEVVYPTDESSFACLDDPTRIDCKGCKNDPDECESVQNILRNRGRRIINLSKLCNANPGELEKALLTADEVNKLAEALTGKENG